MSLIKVGSLEGWIGMQMKPIFLKLLCGDQWRMKVLVKIIEQKTTQGTICFSQRSQIRKCNGTPITQG